MSVRRHIVHASSPLTARLPTTNELEKRNTISVVAGQDDHTRLTPQSTIRHCAVDAPSFVTPVVSSSVCSVEPSCCMRPNGGSNSRAECPDLARVKCVTCTSADIKSSLLERCKVEPSIESSPSSYYSRSDTACSRACTCEDDIRRAIQKPAQCARQAEYYNK